MAKGRKTGGRNFAPGNALGGRPRLPGDVKEARRLTQIDLERTVNKYIYHDKDELKAAAAEPGTSMLDLIVISILAKAVQGGDPTRLDFLLNRVIGKVQDRIEVTALKPFIIHRNDGSSVELGAKIEKEEE